MIPLWECWRDKVVLALVFSDPEGSMGLFLCFQQAESKSEVTGVISMGQQVRQPVNI